MTITVELLTSDGVRHASATDQVTLSVSGGATLGGTTTVAAVAGLATFTGITVNKVGQNYQLTASVGQLTSTSTTFTVTAGPATVQQSSMSVPANVVANGNATLTFTFKDAQSNPASNVAVALSTNLAGSTFTPATGTTDANGGFSTVFKATTSGSAAITVNVGGTSITFPTNVVVAPGASALRFVTPPVSVTAGATFSVAVEILDNAGQRLTTATNPIALTLSAGTLQGTATANAVAGVATFNGLAINAAAVGTLMTATSGALTIQSGAFNITAGVPVSAQSTLALSVALASGAASTATFTFKDALSNVVPNAAVTVTSSIAGTTIVPSTGTTNASGVFTTVITPGAIGAGTITVTVGGTPLVFNVTALGPCVVGAITLDTPLSATLSATSGCLLGVHPASSNRLTIPAGNPVAVALTGTGVSAGFVPEVAITADPPTIPTLLFQAASPATTIGPVEWLLPPGTYRASVSSTNGGGGDFTLLAANLGAGAAGCVPDRPQQTGWGRMLVSVNATYGQAIANTDCRDGPYFYDYFTVADNRPCTISMTATFPIYFQLVADDGSATQPVEGPTTGSIPLTACRTTNSPINIYASTAAEGATGTYSITVSFTGGGTAQSPMLLAPTVLPVTKMTEVFRGRGRR